MQNDTSHDDAPGTWVSDNNQAFTSRQSRTSLVAASVLAAAGLYTLHPFLPALGWAVIFAVSLWPFQSRMAQRWPRHTRLLFPAITTFLVFLTFILPLLLVASALANEVVAAKQWVAQASTQGLPPPAFIAHLPFSDQLLGWWQANLAQPGGLGHLSHGSGAQALMPIDRGERLLAGMFRDGLLTTFMLLTLFFLLRDGERVATGLRIGSQRAFGPAGEHVGNQIIQAIRGTVNGLVIVGFGEGVSLGVTYAIAHVPHAALFALLTALLSVVPLGSLVALAGAVGLLLAEGSMVSAMVVASFGSTVIFCADHFVRPVLIGGATRLPFLLVLLGILGGIEAWGLIGLVLGPALMAALMLLWREWIGAQKGPINPLVA